MSSIGSNQSSPRGPAGQSNRPVVLSLPASDVKGPTDRDRVGLCFEPEIPRRAFNLHMAQERSNRLQIASAFQNVEAAQCKR
jgi:hypothetical protein